MNKLSQILQELSEIPVRAGRWSKLQERLNIIQDAIMALARGENLTSGNHIQIKQIAPNKVSITGTPGGSRAASEDHPWRPAAASSGKVRIRLGNVNGTIIPENWNAEIEIDDTTDAGMMWLEVDINEDGRPTACRYLNADTVPLLAPPSGYDQLPPKLYYLLFAYASDGGEVTNFYIVAKRNLEAVLTMTGSVYSATYRDVTLRGV